MRIQFFRCVHKFVGTTGAFDPHLILRVEMPVSLVCISLCLCSVSLLLFLSCSPLSSCLFLSSEPFPPLSPPPNPALDLPLLLLLLLPAKVRESSSESSDSDRQSELDRRSEWIVQRDTSHESASVAARRDTLGQWKCSACKRGDTIHGEASLVPFNANFFEVLTSSPSRSRGWTDVLLSGRSRIKRVVSREKRREIKDRR